MAEKWCDHDAYGAYAAVPTWGQAQDGDGTAKAVGTPSTAEVVFTGIASTGVIAVLGLLITFTRATSADVCANNLAAAINSLASFATGPSSFTTLSQVRNHLYARGPANGAPAGTCQIMTRQASAAHAGQIAMTHTLNNVSSPATINFVGGSGGCWGWLFNPLVAIWPSGAAQGTYGLWAASPNYTGNQAPGDEIHVRCRAITRPNNTSLILDPLFTRGLPGSPVVYKIDTGIQWTDDAPNPVLSVTSNHTSNTSFSLGISPDSSCVFEASEYSDGTKNFQIVGTGVGPSLPVCRLRLDGAVTYKNIELRSEVTGTGGVQLQTSKTNAPAFQKISVAERCRFNHLGDTTGTSTNFVTQGTNSVYSIKLLNCEFLSPNVLTPWSTGVFDTMGGGNTELLVEGCKFVGFLTGSKLLADSVSFGGQARQAVFRDCDFGGFTNRGPNYLLAALSSRDGNYDRYAAASSNYGAQDFFVERARIGFVEWNSSKGFPTLNALLKDGVTPWSIYVITAPFNEFSHTYGMELPLLYKEIPPTGELPEGARSLTLNLLLESTLTWGKGDIAVIVTYEDTAGNVRVLNLQDTQNPPLDAAPSAAWSSLAFNGQTWLPKSLSVTTPTAVKAGSVVRVNVRVCALSTNVTTGAFFCPEIVVS